MPHHVILNEVKNLSFGVETTLPVTFRCGGELADALVFASSE